MDREIKKILNKIEQNGFEAYVVGGYVRDYLLGKKSNDIDICTNAKPKEIKNIFGTSKENGPYGTYLLKTNQYNYDITTYREEYDYQRRNPSRIEYADNLLHDLKRRDFTMNAICMNKNGKILDFLDGVKDLEKKMIRSIGDPKKRLEEDPLRIIRAIRFACNLNLQIEKELWNAIEEKKNLVLSLSKDRIKKEMDSILLSENFQKGLEDLKRIGVLSHFKIVPKKITFVSDLCGMWAQIKCPKDFPFQKNEKKRIEKIQEILKNFSLDKKLIFQYGLEISMIASKIKGYQEIDVLKIYKQMKIHERKELEISFEEIMNMVKKNAKETKKIENSIIDLILNGKLKNKKKDIIKYLKEVVD